MDKETAIKVIRRFRDSLERSSISVDSIELFGSFATDNYTENSDIDVAVISDSFTGLNHWQRIEKMADALYEVFEPIEARALTIQEWNSGNSLTVQYAKSGTHFAVV
ncbi:MAG: nucleotidyltransferase domain-containing protein [Fibrobacteres bacterium]|nr:nucleotidyltransferase domain-containing protein [Fibrobacterota bacterium]